MYVDENGQFFIIFFDKLKKEVKLEDIEIGVLKYEDDGKFKYEREGKVKFFNVEKGYGFIIEKDIQESYFVYVNDLEEEIDVEDKVVFEIGFGFKGFIVINVQLQKV